ncbi:type II secretion system F family protein [Anatilimnocola floriformis]|uniref:type II secretion system F family protein n=1 Tax=Anatilimnocola floriformis TaxID=2948575 RepID=UPI0020C3D8EC|nr:type II secretion system F family protein [Anatilimnocola floriformis]
MDTSSETIAAGLIGLSLAAMFLAIAWMFRARPNAADEAHEEPGPGIFGSATWLLARVLPDLLPYKARRDLQRCGYLHPQAYDSFLALRNALVIGVILSVGAWLVVVAEDDSLALRVLLVGGIALLLAYSLPRVYLNWRGDQAADQTVLGLPDALEMIVMGLSGGLSIHPALARACDELTTTYPVLATQLRIVRRQAAAATLELAFERWAERVELDEVSGLAALISQAERTGVSIATTLRNYADTLRLQRMQRLQSRSNRVAIQMLFPTVLCLAPATYIVLLAPPLLDLQRFREEENRAGGLLERKAKIDSVSDLPAGR